MTHFLRPAAMLATLALVPWMVVVAQTTATPARPTRPAGLGDPADPASSAPRAVHHSALANYRRAAEPTPLAWREANDNVGRIGGWRAYAREAAGAPAGAASGAAAAASTGSAASTASPATPASGPRR